MSNRPRLSWTARIGWGVAALVLVAGGLSLYHFWIAPRAARSARADNLAKLAQAMLTYSEEHRDRWPRLPAAALRDKDGKPLLSWRVAILPFLGEEGLYQEFKLDEPWDSPHNLRLLPRMPKVYASVWGDAPAHTTRYQVITGPCTAFSDPRGPRIPVSFRNGTRYTILIVEADKPVPWTKPADIVLATPEQPLSPFGGVWGNLGDLWGDGFFAAMADGSVGYIKLEEIRVPSGSGKHLSG